LITRISAEINRDIIAGGSAAENALVSAVRDLAREVKAVHATFALFVSVFQAPSSHLNANF
jgi:hypothetical protein